MDFDQLNESVERLIQNLQFIQSLEEEGIPMSDDHRDMILRNIDTITNMAKEDFKAQLLFDVRQKKAAYIIRCGLFFN